MSQMTPREIVQELEKHIIGQDEAKRAVAIALRNRWRRVQVDEPLRGEIPSTEASFGKSLLENRALLDPVSGLTNV